MTRPNPFKTALAARAPLMGLWCGLADPYAIEIVAGAGFDWLVLDAEHAPNDVRTVLAQLQVLAAYPGSHPVVRLPHGDADLIKRYLDIGAETLLIPMVESAARARALVAATRYPPAGIRGVGTALARAARWNRESDYLATANDRICLIVQVENQAGLTALDEIVAVEGVDGVFIGPADLAASLGHLGAPAHPTVVAAIEPAIARIATAGKAAGVMTSDPALVARYRAAGANFFGLSCDTTVLAQGATALARQFAP